MLLSKFDGHDDSLGVRVTLLGFFPPEKKYQIEYEVVVPESYPLSDAVRTAVNEIPESIRLLGLPLSGPF